VENKTCTKCGESKPATSEFWFLVAKKAPGKFRADCRVCINEQKRKQRGYYEREHLPEDQIRCPYCKLIFPATDEFFYKETKLANGFASGCKICRYERYEKKRKREKAERTDAKRATGRIQMAHWRSNNSERSRELVRQSYERHREKRLAETKAWRMKNPDSVRTSHEKSKAKRSNVVIGEFTREHKDAILIRQVGRCYYCDIQLVDMHWDHMNPVSRGGIHDHTNMCASCVDCNLAKSAKTAEEFLAAFPERLRRSAS
jgi:hypothetical protein